MAGWLLRHGPHVVIFRSRKASSLAKRARTEAHRGTMASLRSGRSVISYILTPTLLLLLLLLLSLYSRYAVLGLGGTEGVRQLLGTTQQRLGFGDLLRGSPRLWAEDNRKHSGTLAKDSGKGRACGPASLQAVGSRHLLQDPLRIFVYELPPQFLQGVVDGFGRKKRREPPYEYPLDRQMHSAEWYLYESLVTLSAHPAAARRVTSPDAAELFLVPFFSSLSVQVEDVDGGGDIQNALLVWLEQRPSWRRNRGRDHIFFAGDPNALAKVRGHINRSILLLSDFARYRPSQASLTKDVVIPYAHLVPAGRGHDVVNRERTHGKGDDGMQDGGEEEGRRNILLHFAGEMHRKDGGLRTKLFKMLLNQTGVVISEGHPTPSKITRAGSDMLRSQFCLHPAGDTPSSCRIFDQIMSSCIPVVVSDKIVLPFEDHLDYSDFCVFVGEKDAVMPGFLVGILRNLTLFDVSRMRRRLNDVQSCFEYGPGGDAVAMIWAKLAAKLPSIREAINMDRRMERVGAFLSNGRPVVELGKKRMASGAE